MEGVATEVTALLQERVALDTSRRRLLAPGDVDYPPASQVVKWHLPPKTAAIVLTPDGRLSTVLDLERAMSAAWIEDAFICALRDSDFAG
jgi:hypothetical protein